MPRPAWWSSLSGSPVLLTVLAFLAVAAGGHGFFGKPLGPGLDPSFMWAYNVASAQGLRWGREFISTYGPYGHVLLPLDVDGLMAARVVFALVVAAGTAIVGVAYLWSVPGLGAGTRLVLLGLLVFVYDFQTREYQWLALLILVLLVAVRSKGRTELLAYGIAGTMAGAAIPMKLSLGFACLLTVATGCLPGGWPWRLARRLPLVVFGAAAGFLAVWLVHGGSVDDIAPFLTTGSAISNGYSSAMSLQPPFWAVGVATFLAWMLLIVLWAVAQRRSGALLSLWILAVPLFFTWKHSIVRQDVHVASLMLVGMFVMLIMGTHSLATWPVRRIVRIVALLFIPLLLPWPGVPGWSLTTLPRLVLGPLTLPGGRDLLRLGRLAVSQEELRRKSRAALREDELPEAVRSTIGQASVDVYPWEVAYVPANDLSWVHRPQPASFSGYTPLLDRLNAGFFASARTRPRYVLWHASWRGDPRLRSIDGRHVFFDEPETLRTIFSTYDVLTTAPDLILLGARSRPRFGPPRAFQTVTAAWDTWLEVPHGPGVTLAHVDVRRSPLALAVRAVFREDPILISMRFATGERREYRIVPDNAGQGLWIDPFAITLAELPALLRGEAPRRVVAIKLGAGRRAFLYGSPVVSWSRLTPEFSARATARGCAARARS